jgi:hypothetical protein
MPASSFDSTHAIQFDLDRGRVRPAGEDESVILVPAGALASLVSGASPAAVEASGTAMGAAIGRRVRVRLPSVADASVEAVVTQLAGEAALGGIGVLAVERWGRAVVVLVEGSSLPSSLLAPLVAAALEAVFGRRVGCTLLSSDGQSSRVLVASERAIDRVRGWLTAGIAWGDALTRLHGDAA